MRRTKIVATIGPASRGPEILEAMIEAGVDVVRMNFSHGDPEQHIATAELVRQLARHRGHTVGVMADLQGPKIRIGKFANGKIQLKRGQKFILDAAAEIGDEERVGLDYKELPRDVSKGTVLLLDDGRIVLSVLRVQGSEIFCKALQGGVLSNNKGINRKDGGLSAPALTSKDKLDVRIAARMKADYVAVSFVRSAQDVAYARELIRDAGSKAMLIAKIERAEAIPVLDDILNESDVIMVARGDLAAEMGDAVVPALQKRLIKAARGRNKLVVTATQMMESMVSNPIPTRAEVSDVANAVLDGTDAVMLSAETAAGAYPLEAVQAMVRVCVEAEKECEIIPERRFMNEVFTRIDQSIAMAALFSAYHVKARAIGALTQSGSTALRMSRTNVGVPIYALSSLRETRRKVTLASGVHPIRFTSRSHDREEVLRAAEEELLHRGAVAEGDLIVLTIGEMVGKAGQTNTMKVVRVGDGRA